MKRLEFLEKARALAAQQCSDSSCLTDTEFKDLLEGTTEEVALYKKALEILTNASHDMDSTFMEISRNEEDS